MNKILQIFLLSISTQILFAQSTTPIYINEFMASNASVIADSTGEFEDWIELYNSLSTPFDISGYFLSDDPNNLQKYEIPQNISISGGGFILFWASGESSRGDLHTNFRLSASQGEYIFLTAPNGTNIIDSIDFESQTTDVSYGRYPNGSNSWAYFKTPTPNASNNSSIPYTMVLNPPVFSHTGGFISSGFSLNITAPDSGVTIYYTLDGSEPNPNRVTPHTYTYKNQYKQFANSPNGPQLNDSIQSYAYNGAITIVDRNSEPNRTSRKSSTFEFNPPYLPTNPIRKGTVVRAIATRADAISSEIVTETFFVGPSITNHYSFPVVSLSIDENLLFDLDDGIYCAGADFENWRSNTSDAPRGNSPANWRRSGRTYEYPMGFEYFDSQGNKEFSQLVGARIHGGFSRARRRKSLRLYARSEYGKSEFNYPLFSNRTDTAYKRILLRNSGNDEPNTSFRDAFIQNLVMHLNFEIQHSEATIVFINGEYWGIHNFREWQNKHYIERIYGIQNNELDFITERMDVQDGDSLHFTQLLNFVNSNDLSQDSLFSHIETQMDVENFTDYVIAQVYSRNSDWPTNNVKWWRKRVPYSPNAPEGHDGRWRWLAYDMDFGFGWHRGLNEVNQNTLAIARNNAEVGQLLRNLWPNETYASYFVNRYADLMNTCFLPAHVHSVVDSMTAIYQPEINEHSQRWRHHTGVSQWMNDVNLIKTWSNLRTNHARTHLKGQFQLPAEHQITIDVSDTLQGYVRVNTIEILEQTVGVPSSPYPWSGVYFEDNPIQLEAYPNQGYNFSHWEIGGASFTTNPIDINMVGDSLITAYFTSDSSIVCGSQIAHELANCPYIFEEWSPQSAAGSTPPNMEFVYFNQTDPSANAMIAGAANGAFNHQTRTRINGLNEDGLGFINTGNTDGNPGFPGTKLGGVILNLNTQNMNGGFVQFTAGTIEPGSREYHLKLQYRLGVSEPWHDLLDSNGNAIEYQRNANFNHSEIIGPHPLPASLMERECLQIMWRYYYTGQRNSQISGARDFLRLDDIIVSSGNTPSSPITTLQGTGAGDIVGNLAVLPSETNGYQVNVFPGANYIWRVTNGTILAGQNTPQISVQWGTNGVGTIQVEIMDGNCLRQSKATVNISGISTQNFSGETGVVIYPNPANNRFNISFPIEFNARQVLITDPTGRTVWQQNIHNQTEIEVEHRLAAGKYLVQIADDNGMIIHRQRVILIP